MIGWQRQLPQRQATGRNAPFPAEVRNSCSMIRQAALVCAAVYGLVVTGCGRPAAAQELDRKHSLSGEQSVQAMQVADGFVVELVASEPLVRQPVAIEFDDRGRLWVIQYLQYPNPAGLKRVQVDRYSRTRYDRVPEPPPHGPRGADRITILTDTDHDGSYDAGRDFVDGLNLATGLAFGHGGVFVLNVPYLLFYPDRNRDDRPDGEPQVLLKGFGMEDAHSVANSLTWGPDGWLYGCQGSTVTANIRGIEFQQGVWRYHPVTHEFELFCEGGGNSWGLDFDRTGRLFYSTNYGGYVLLHGVQGGYFVKSFAKHGELHNPHAYGYFQHAPHANFRGGHVTVGGIIYQGQSFPAQFRGQYIAGDLLGHGVYWHNIQPWGSTVKTAHAGELLESRDPWFAPTDVMLGPDGAIYVSDWHDARTAHPDPDADWDRRNGRIYRIAAKGTPRATGIDFAELSNDRLLELHNHPSQWFVRRARVELASRAHHSRIAPDELQKIHQILKSQVSSSNQEVHSLEALWTLTATGGFDEPLAEQFLDSPHPAVRSWTVRLLGDLGEVSESMAHRLDEFAEQEPDAAVRQQLASSARRLPAHQAVPIVNANINRDIDNSDPYLPLLWWWAIEQHSVSGRDEVLRRFVRPTLWKSELGRDFLMPRLLRRYAAEASPAGLASLTRLVQAAPGSQDRLAMWSAITLGWREADAERLTPELLQQARDGELGQLCRSDWRAASRDLTLHELTMRLGFADACESARMEAFQSETDPMRRTALLELLSVAPTPDLIAPAMALVRSKAPIAVRTAALQLLGRFNSPQVTSSLVELMATAEEAPLLSAITDLLLSRTDSASAWLAAVDEGRIDAQTVPLEQVRKVALLESAELNQLVVKHWGRLEAASAGEKLAEVRRLNNDVRAAPGDPRAGVELFRKHCAACHQLFGEGKKVGPDLTTANRQDRNFLLVSLVDPSSVIRKEYVSVIIQTVDGRVLTGLPVMTDDSAVTLMDSRNKLTTVARADIEEMRDSPVSLMPADLYRQLTPQQLRDLFAFLQSKAKP